MMSFIFRLLLKILILILLILSLAFATPFGLRLFFYFLPDVSYQSLHGQPISLSQINGMTWKNFHIEQISMQREHGLSWTIHVHDLSWKDRHGIQINASLNFSRPMWLHGTADRIPFDWIGQTTLQSYHPTFEANAKKIDLRMPKVKGATHGSLHIQGQGIDMVLRQNRNHIILHHHPDDLSHIKIFIPNVHQLIPDTTGNIQGDLHLNHEQLTDSNLTIQNFTYQEWNIHTLAFQAQCHQQCIGSMTAEVPDNPMGIPLRSKLHFKEVQPHVYQWNKHSEGFQWTMDAKGTWHAKTWRYGTLDIAEIKSLIAGTPWHLKSPTKIKFGEKIILSKPLCLTHLKQKICLNHHKSTMVELLQIPLKIFQPLMPILKLPINQIEGLITGHLEWDKTLWPKGQVQLKHVGLHLPTLGTIWHNGHLTLKTEKKKVKYQGVIYNHHHPLEWSGYWTVQQPRTGISHFKAHHVELLKREQAQLMGHLDLTIQAKGKIRTLSGHVDFLGGKIHQPDLSAMITLPSETLIVEHGHSSTRLGSFLPLQGEAQVKTTGPISVKMIGIQGLLSGNMNMHFAPKHPITAEGEFNLKDAAYLPLPDIMVNRASISYKGNDLLNPNLNIELMRRADATSQIDFDHPTTVLDPLTVSLFIGGTIRSPSYHVSSSNANLNQGEMLAALLSGQTSMNAISGLSAASALNSNPLMAGQLNPMARLREILHLREFSFSMGSHMGSSSDGINHPSLTVRKNIGKKAAIYSRFALDDEDYTLSLLYSFAPDLLAQTYLNERGYGGQLLYRWE